MATRGSVRAILVAGYGLAAGILVILVFVVLGEDEVAPERPSESVAGERRTAPRATPSPSYDPNSAITPKPSLGELLRASEEARAARATNSPTPRDDESANVSEGWKTVADAQRNRVIGAPSDLDEVSRMTRAQELAAAGLVPEYDDDGFVGLRVRGEPDPESMLGLLGVTSGTLITSVNGMQAGDAGIAPQSMMQELSAQREVELTVGQ